MNNKTPDKRTYKAPVKNAAAKKPETKITKKAAPAKAAEGSLRAKFSKFNFNLKKQRLKYGSLATVVSLLLVTAVILGNVLVGIVTDKYGLKFDMTSEQRFELSDATIDMLEELDKEVTLHVFMTEENFRAMTYGNEMAEIMYRYEVHSGGKVTVNYVDPIRNPGFVHKYESIVEISNGSIVIESGEKYRALALSDLYYWYDSTQTSAVGVSIERRLSNSILYMDVENPPTAAILSGHSGVGGNNIAQQFYEANYNVITLNLMTDEIPDEVSVLIECCPTTDYTESEILKLEKYFKTYRDFIFIAGADAPKLTNLELLFREWGVEFDNSLVCDSQYRVGGNYVNVATIATATDHNLTSGFGTSKYVIAPYSKPMTIVPIASELYSVTELLQTSPSSYAKVKADDTTIESYEQADGDEVGPFSSAILTTYSQIVNNKTVSSNLLFISTPYMFDASIMESDSYGNMRFLTNIINEFNPGVSTLDIRSKRFTDPELEVIGNDLSIMLVLLCTIPAVIIIMGIVVWYRRKNR